MKRLLFVISEDWYFVSHRLQLAIHAKAMGYRVAVLCRVSTHAELLKKSGIEVFPWLLERRSKNPLTEWRALRGARSAIRAFQPDVLHAVALKPVLYSAIAGKSQKSEGRVFALAGLGYVFSSQKMLARCLRPFIVQAFRAAFRNPATRLILQNPDDAQVLSKAKVIASEKIRLIRGAGVDMNAFPAIPEPELNDQQMLVVLPGRMLWDKGVAEFVEAARLLQQRGIRARFALVGGRDDHNPSCVPLQMLKDWESEGVVEYWGNRNDMPAVLAQAHVVCLPSYREGLPKALLEAASCARPIVTFDVPGCREVVVHGKNGLLVPFGDVVALANALEALMADRSMRVQMGAQGRLMVQQEFSQELVAEKTMQVWEEVLA
ncbi:glycosyltransferase involved in cell wall biosynthesis [Variovorax boronicumulans]|uniref:Glycosyltransferase involved in cell wall biosynthesis n=1 Tax=Variovorax boronicumulans TaxID=436515 RepID=A0AAW8D1S8_9BURK|nr:MULTISPECIES: glycosyltransferase family 4 protein [Variovorax]MDP9894169.1 glycosyltransferase involved in cell wall biosynthesis [Variovorax boronicumulans]MDQ0053988.1 glycosyltransferase involved in cell wall biosynthesis [Variovorax boronicumulans]MDQ0606605.1 glycosyltransferase involved in cell wall biosynthesis [Variovorax sp. W1I1]